MWDEPVDKPHQSGFPAAAPPAKKHTLSGRNGEVNIIKTAVYTAGIGKRYILKFNHTHHLHIISVMRNTRNSPIASQSAASI